MNREPIAPTRDCDVEDEEAYLSRTVYVRTSAWIQVECRQDARCDKSSVYRKDDELVQQFVSPSEPGHSGPQQPTEGCSDSDVTQSAKTLGAPAKDHYPVARKVRQVPIRQEIDGNF